MNASTNQLRRTESSYLLCSRKDGIGARISNLLWTWRLARNSGLRTLCFWPPLDSYYGENHGVGELLDLFVLNTSALEEELKVVDGRPIDSIRADFVRLELNNRHDAKAYSVTPEVADNQPHSRVPVIDSGHGPLLAPGEHNSVARKEARVLFGRLPLSLDIRKALSHIDKVTNLDDVIAVHVRRGDIVATLRDACENFTPTAHVPRSVDRYTEHFFRGCAPSPGYMRVIRPYLKQGHRILFFSDTPAAVQPFERRFPSKLLIARNLAPARLTNAQTALFEICLMSRCCAVVGAKSMFSSLASLVGEIPLVDVRRKSSAEEYLRAYKRVVGFDGLDRSIQNALVEIVVRKLTENGFLDFWRASSEDIRALLEAA